MVSGTSTLPEEPNSSNQSTFGGIRLQHFFKQDACPPMFRTLRQMVPKKFCVCRWLEYKVLICSWMRPMARATRWWDVTGESSLTTENLTIQRSLCSNSNTWGQVLRMKMLHVMTLSCWSVIVLLQLNLNFNMDKCEPIAHFKLRNGYESWNWDILCLYFFLFVSLLFFSTLYIYFLSFMLYSGFQLQY